MQKNVSSQKLIVFAFDSTTNLPKTGDAANITAYESLDYGAVTVLGDISATEMDATNAKGYYLFDLTQAETNANTILFSAKSSTSNIVVIGVPATVFTDPANYTAFSLNSSGQVDVIKLNGTSQTARDIGASVLLSSGTGTGQVSLSSGTVTIGTNNDKTGYTLSGTQTFNNTGTWTGNISGSVGSVTGLTASNLDATVSSRMATYSQPTGFLAATFPSGTIANTTNITAGTITTATNLTNAPTIGDLTATMKASVTTAATAATPTAAAVTGSVGSIASGGITGASFAAFVEGYTTLATSSTYTLPNMLYDIHRRLYSRSVTSTTESIYEVDGTTVAHTIGLDSAIAPTSAKQIT